MTKVILHVGIGKTGTTALQSYLSFNPIMKAEAATYEYVAIGPAGEFIRGDSLREQAMLSPLASVSSTPYLGKIADLRAVGNRIKCYAESTGHTLILSQEDWSRCYQDFRSGSYLKLLDIEVDVIFYVRPQVEWFQSGWWQWWSWLDEFETPEQVIDKWGKGIFKWNGWVRQWESIENVRSMTLRLHSSNVVQDFAEALQVTDIDEQKSREIINPTLGLTGIKLLRAFPLLKRAHNSHLDVKLSKLLPNDSKAPWVVSPDLASRIIDQCRPYNEELAARLPETAQARMRKDPRWWDSRHYADRTWVDMRDIKLSKQEIWSAMEEILLSSLTGGKG